MKAILGLLVGALCLGGAWAYGLTVANHRRACEALDLRLEVQDLRNRVEVLERKSPAR